MSLHDLYNMVSENFTGLIMTYLTTNKGGTSRWKRIIQNFVDSIDENSQEELARDIELKHCYVRLISLEKAKEISD